MEDAIATYDWTKLDERFVEPAKALCRLFQHMTCISRNGSRQSDVYRLKGEMLSADSNLDCVVSAIKQGIDVQVCEPDSDIFDFGVEYSTNIHGRRHS